MFSEPTFNNTESSVESMKARLKTRLKTILYSELTVENIEEFASIALEDLISLNNEILKEYIESKDLKPLLKSSVREQEDDAYRKLSLPDIQEILEEIMKVGDKIKILKEELEDKIKKTNKVITPTDPKPIPDGDGSGVERVFFPRLLTLVYILSTDFGIEPDSLNIIKGAITPEMFREEPYYRIDVPDLDRVVYICDEQDNASYVFDSEKIDENGLDIKEIDTDNKTQKKELMRKYPGIGVKIIQSSRWRENISSALIEDIPIRADIEKSPSVDYVEKPFDLNLVPRTEFIPRTRRENWSTFDVFQQEVRLFYPGNIRPSRWYQQERKHHTNWPSNPHKVYRDLGWVGFPELVGNENRLKKGHLSFDEFKEEVTSLYPGHGSVQDWYKEEKSKHPNWYANPADQYHEQWVGFPELVDRENRLKKEYLPFDEFKEEVLSLYPGRGNVAIWYHKERKNHSNWHSVPAEFYKDQWFGWPELVDRENPFKKEYLPFDKFKEEVLSLYPGRGNIQDWYYYERKNHNNWHAHPEVFYKDKWIGFPELVDRENRLKKEWPTFEQFRDDVRSAYPRLEKGVMNAQVWYHKERKKHPNWTSTPEKVYAGKGWAGYSSLVGNKD